MIPWTDFEQGVNDDFASCPTVSLEAYWVASIEHGESMAAWTLRSPMMELAHERRFVITQQGRDGADDASAHVSRISECLQYLEKHLVVEETTDPAQRDSNPDAQGIGVWTANFPHTYATTLDSSHLEDTTPYRSWGSSSDEASGAPTRTDTDAKCNYPAIRDSDFPGNVYAPFDPAGMVAFLRASTMRPNKTRALKPVRMRNKRLQKPSTRCAEGWDGKLEPTARFPMSKDILSHSALRHSWMPSLEFSIQSTIPEGNEVSAMNVGSG